MTSLLPSLTSCFKKTSPQLSPYEGEGVEQKNIDLKKLINISFKILFSA
jgi:hypothetical protein